MPDYAEGRRDDTRAAPRRRHARWRPGLTWAAALLVLSVAGASLATGSEGDTGADATESPEGDDCESGIAITTEFGAVCSEVCESDATCPEAWGCKQVPQPGADPIGLCFPLRVSVTE